MLGFGVTEDEAECRCDLTEQFNSIWLEHDMLCCASVCGTGEYSQASWCEYSVCIQFSVFWQAVSLLSMDDTILSSPFHPHHKWCLYYLGSYKRSKCGLLPIYRNDTPMKMKIQLSLSYHHQERHLVQKSRLPLPSLELLDMQFALFLWSSTCQEPGIWMIGRDSNQNGRKAFWLGTRLRCEQPSDDIDDKQPVWR